ncbi:MAG: heparan-alpha-glucosaminide N-acetyltransferase domain-containing protein [Opitutaceae bacterium]|jgi:predicted acyltransferase
MNLFKRLLGIDSKSETPAPAADAGKKQRLMSLDALRGFDMFWIVGGEGVLHTWSKTSGSPFAHLMQSQMEHSRWVGLTFYDIIFPLFVFITGVSLVFSLGKLLREHGQSGALKRIFWRGLLLYLLGIIYNGGVSHLWPDVRITGVLPRIAVAYVGAGLIFCLFKERIRWAIAALLLAGYWALLTFVPIRDIAVEKHALRERLGAEPTLEQVHQLYENTHTTVTGHYGPGYNLADHLDFLYLPGAKCDTYFDPEGLLSMLPAIATCLLGVFAGCWLIRKDRTEGQKLAGLFVAGVLCLGLGCLWAIQFPIIKKLWTSSYVLTVGGLSLLLLGIFYYIVDMRRWRGWCQPFVWIGLNPITLYLASSLVDFHQIARRFVGGSVSAFFDTHFCAGASAVVVAISAVGLLLLLARFLHRKQIYLRV